MYKGLEGHSLGSNIKCFFCNSNVYRQEDPRALLELYLCPICGKFRLGGMIDLWRNGLTPAQRSCFYKISFELRSVAERALGKADNSYFPPYSPEDLARMLEATEPPVTDKLSLLLRFLARNTLHPGQTIVFDEANDYSVVCAQNAREAFFYIQTLREQGLINYVGTSVTPPGDEVMITAKGWSELSRLDHAGVDSHSGFIAMAFSPDRDPAEKSISAAIRATGYLPIRVDKVEHVNKIDDEIIARIRASKFLVADFTLQRNGVYFEAGFMLGLGRPVIWLCEKSDLANVHFDTRQYNTVTYADPADLQTRLQTRIEAVIGRGPLVVSQ